MPWILAVLCGTCFCCSASTKEVYKDEVITVTETVRSLVPFSPHVGIYDTISIHVFEKTYKNVRGWKPYHLEIPQKNSILFVTGRDYDNGQATVYIVNLKTKKALSFPAHDSHIGSNICPKDKETEQGFEKVESVTGDKLVITAGSLDTRFRYFLDLKEAKFEKEEAEFLDASNGTTNRFVYINGKRPKN